MNTVDIFPFQALSMEDFSYLGLMIALVISAYLLSKLKGSLRYLGSCGLIFFPFGSIGGYLCFLILKKLGVVSALLGSFCLMMFFPLLVMSFSLLFESESGRKNFSLPSKAKDYVQPSVYALLLLIGLVYFIYLIFQLVRDYSGFCT